MYNKPSKIDFVVRIIFCVFLSAFMILPTLYVTVLYKHTPIETVDYILKDVSFLPMNIDKANGNTNEETTGSTVNENQFTFPPVTNPVVTEMPTQPITSEPTEVVTDDNKVTVPDFSKYTYSQIKGNSKFNKDFSIIYEFEYSDTVEENHVIGQRAAVGERIEKGSKVNIVISRGVEEILLRDVVGMDYDTAKELLTFAGFEVKSKVISNDGTQTPNQVFSMGKKPDKKYKRGTVIELTIWSQ